MRMDSISTIGTILGFLVLIVSWLLDSGRRRVSPDP